MGGLPRPPRCLQVGGEARERGVCPWQLGSWVGQARPRASVRTACLQRWGRWTLGGVLPGDSTGSRRGHGAGEPAPARRLPSQAVCTLVAAFLHFFFLSSFCWVLTEAWQSYMAVTGRLRNRLVRKRFLCLGWGEHCRAAGCPTRPPPRPPSPSASSGPSSLRLQGVTWLCLSAR